MTYHDPRRTILILAGTYLPGYKAGGPVRSIANLVAALGHEFDFKIVTLDRDVGDSSPFPGVTVNQWVRVGQADVMYLQPGLRGLIKLTILLHSIDHHTILYLNSFFSRRFSMLPVHMRWLKLCRPHRVVLAPRGEFSLGALGIKRKRKTLYIQMSRRLGLYDPAIWQASSEFEAEDISRQFPALRDLKVADPVGDQGSSQKRVANSIMTASALITVSDVLGAPSYSPSSKPNKRIGELRIAFVGRCSRMKNLSGALKLLSGLSGEISFDLYGPAEDAEYWRECQAIIAALPPNIRVRNHGGINHERVCQVLGNHDLLLLPTLGENFGHVIYESLASGCPVLISDKTPWRNLEVAGVGWDLPLNQMERFQSVIQQCVDGDSEWIAEMSRRAKAYAERYISDPLVVESNRKLFDLAL